MSTATPGLVLRLQSAARWRALAIVLLVCMPVVLALAALAWRFGNATHVVAVLVVGLSLVALAAWRRMAALDRRWLVRALDLQRRDMEDSGDLLFADVTGLNALQRLQLARLRRRLDSGRPPDLRAPWPWRSTAASVLGSSAVLAATLLWPASSSVPTAFTATQPPATATVDVPPRLAAQRLVVQPPAYTTLPERESDALDAKLPERSQLRWRLRFDPGPQAAELVFLDGRRVPLQREQDTWAASARIDDPALYRIVTDGDRPLHPERLYRLDVVRDQPPQIRVTAPDANLVLRGAGQRHWSLAFEASDDHGIDAGAQLRITAAQGTGENITFKEEARVLRGSGGRTSKRFTYRLDLDALGLSEGDDLIVQFTVSDNRAPGPQQTRSASYILRWPAPQPMMESGLEGLVRTTLPAYFRSQRQIIIDAEALLKQKPSLPADTYVSRSDAIGVDQRLLRLRYGQFLGEESEGAPRRPLMPTNDAQDIATAREAEAETREAETGTEAHDDHHAGEPPDTDAPQGFGREGDLLEEFGHTHDHAEAATLLDPETRTTLRAALDQMWQSELKLRTGKPDAALRYAHRALEFIKQVQQASRIYLGRVGSPLPPVDMSRRLTGKREGLGDRSDALAAAERDHGPADVLWRVLADAPQALDAPIEAFVRWLRGNDGDVQDPLALAAAADRVRRDPGCDECRQELRGLLWPLLSPPPTAPAPRVAPDRSGRAYLDALQRGGTP